MQLQLTLVRLLFTYIALALKVENGDRVLVTTNTFAASANCVRYCGANVEFVIDRDSFLIDIDLLAER